MRHALGACVVLAALAGCDARASESYRGESLLRVTGRLLVAENELQSDAVPALAFEGTNSLHLLDVDTHGSFPANFTIDVMSPPPAAAMRSYPNLPSYAVGYITAAAADHPASFTLPAAVDGAGGFSWCENRDNTDCYRSVEQCIKGTDQCYRELARCVRTPVAGSTENLVREVCSEILEQSGDPTIANPWENFVGLSTNYFVLYVASAAPAGAARNYVNAEIPDGVVASVFGTQPITAGYHLIRATFLSEQEQETVVPCIETIENELTARFNTAHGTSHATTADLAGAIVAAGGSPFDDPEYKALMTELGLRMFDAGCYNGGGGIRHERVDPSSAPIEVVLGTRDLFPQR